MDTVLLYDDALFKFLVFFFKINSQQIITRIFVFRRNCASTNSWGGEEVIRSSALFFFYSVIFCSCQFALVLFDSIVCLLNLVLFDSVWRCGIFHANVKLIIHYLLLILLATFNFLHLSTDYWFTLIMLIGKCSTCNCEEPLPIGTNGKPLVVYW